LSKLVILSGPSCIGKGPLFKALQRFYPHLGGRFQQLVLFNDRAPRPGEEEGVDYIFRPRTEIEALRGRDGYLVADVRGDVQVLELAQIQRIMDGGKIPFFEGNPFVPAILRQGGVLEHFSAVSIFLSPLSREEILYLKAPERKVDLAALITDVQRRKLLVRTTLQKMFLSLKDLENIEKRAASAIVELREAWWFDYVIPLYDGEGNVNWDAFYYPIGSARLALENCAAILEGRPAPQAEHWERELIP